MNYRAVFYSVGVLLKVIAGLLILPLALSVITKDGFYYAFLIPAALLLITGFLLAPRKNKEAVIYVREGFAIVGISWILISLFGTLPFVISGQIPNFIDAFFETVSGFTTTGSTVIANVEALTRSLLFWRAFTHWIGGMGVLVFVLAFMPDTKSRSIFIMRAESPGPKVGKIVAKMKFTARILYLIYIVLSLIQIMLLSFKMPLFDSVTHTLATAGTGGFSIKNTGIMFYDSVYIEVVITIFMFLFGVNFTVFYLILIGKVAPALKSEELRWYVFIVVLSVVLITINCYSLYGSFARTLRYSSFQVTSIITTTGFANDDFNNWPVFSKTILVILMMIGACGGSTGGGIKVSRVVMYFKMVIKEIKYSINPRQITTITFENEPVGEDLQKGIAHYLTAYMFILVFGVLIIAVDGHSFITNVTTVVTCLNNVGPGLDLVGPAGNFSVFSQFSKIALSFIMLAGRLEIFPILILFTPKMWSCR